MKVELTHDILALKVFEKASTEDKMRQKLERLLEDRYTDYQEKGMLLGTGDLERIRPFHNKLDISEDAQQFIRRSERALHKKTIRRRNMAIAVIATLLVLLLGVFFLWKKAQYNGQAQRAIRLAQQATAALQEGKTAVAFRLAEEAYRSHQHPANRKAAHNVLKSLRENGLVCQLLADDHIMALDFSQKFILTAFDNGQVTLWNTNCEKYREYSHRKSVNAASFSPEGDYVLTASDDTEVILFDTNTGKQTPFPHPAPVKFASFSPDGKFFLTGTGNSTVRLFSIEGEVFNDKKTRMPGQLINLEFSPKSDYYLAATSDSVAIMNLLTGQRSGFVTQQPVRIIHFNQSDADALRIFIAYDDRGEVTDLTGTPDQYQSYGDLNETLSGEENITGVEFGPLSSDSTSITIIVNDTIVQHWTKGRKVNEICPINLMDYYLIYNTTRVSALEVSPRGNYLLLGLDQNRLEIKNATEGGPVRGFWCNSNRISVSPNDKFFVTSSAGSETFLWEINPKKDSVSADAILDALKDNLRKLTDSEKSEYQF